MTDTPAERQRIAAIDLLRGVAIMWVVLYHLWSDFEIFSYAPEYYYRALADDFPRWDAGMITRATDVFFRNGYQGVPLFMMFSGLTLTIAALRRPEPPAFLPFFRGRVVKILPAYWIGFAYALVVIAGVALVRSWLYGEGFLWQLQNGVTFAVYVPVPIDAGQIFAGATMLPRIMREEWMYAPSAVLWFVPLLLQYYALFPLLYRALLRFGPLPLLVAAIAFTIGAQMFAIAVWGEFVMPQQVGWILAPMRVVEFVAGMALGYAYVRVPERFAFARSWPAIIAIVAGAAVVHTYSSMLTTLDRYEYALASTLIILSLTAMCVPLLVADWRRAMALAPVALIATTGAASYGVLIVNEPFRYVMSLMRVELPDPVWWTILVVLYVPATIYLGVLLSRWLGFMPPPSTRDAQPDVAKEVPHGASA